MTQGRKPADGTLQGEFEHAMDILDGASGPLAMYWIDGHVRCVKRSSMSCWTKFMRKHQERLIGVYDQGADARCVLADIREVMESTQFAGVDIDAVHNLAGAA